MARHTTFPVLPLLLIGAGVFFGVAALLPVDLDELGSPRAAHLPPGHVSGEPIEEIDIPPLFGEPPYRAKCDSRVSNTTDSVMRFNGVLSSCGCANAQLATKTLAPGEETVLHVEIDVPETASQRRVLCVIERDDGTLMQRQFNVSVFPSIQFPEQLSTSNVGVLTPGGHMHRTIEVFLHSEGRDSAPPEIVAIRTADERIRATFVNSRRFEVLANGIATRRKATMEFDVSWKFGSGPFASQVEVEYAGKGLHGCKPYTLSGIDQPALELTPQRIRVEWVEDGGDSVERAIVVRRLDGNLLNLLSIKPNSPTVTVTCIERIARDSVRVVFSIASFRGDTFYAEAAIHTDHPLQSVLSVPISGKKHVLH